MARADVYLTQTNAGASFSGGGTRYVVQANNGDLYWVYIDAQSDVVYTKSTNKGITWTAPVAVSGAITARALAIWFDRWSGIAAGKIHCAYTDDTGSDILYASIDTESSDTVSTPVTVFNGASSASGGALTIWRSRGTNTIRIAGAIDAGAEDGAWSSTDSGATWADTIADPSEGATQDQYFGLPGWNADANDEMIIFIDASANGLSVKRYDDSGNTWTETAIIADGSFTDQVAATAFPHVACFVDIANSRNVIACWNAVDAANQDLRVFVITDSAITETTTNAVLNATDDCGLVAFAIDTVTGYWYVFYGGKSDGSETYNTSMMIYYKISTDAGETWGAETQLSTQLRTIAGLWTTPRFSGDFLTAWYNDATNDNEMCSVTVATANLFAGKL